MVYVIDGIHSRKNGTAVYKNEWDRSIRMIHLKVTEPMIFRYTDEFFTATVSTKAVVTIEDVPNGIVVRTTNLIYYFTKLGDDE